MDVVGDRVGAGVKDGRGVGFNAIYLVGFEVGDLVGCDVGCRVGCLEGCLDG